ncbi:hypothetical protein QBS70_21195 [Cronobacter sakazakii]|nr:hypothetical protein [Cronobacter sakazakii]
MHSDVILTQPGGWINGVYVFVSLLLLAGFIVIKTRRPSGRAVIKVTAFFLYSCLLTSSVFLFFRYGLTGVYELAGYYPQDALWVRLAALALCCAYAFCLPFRYARQ